MSNDVKEQAAITVHRLVMLVLWLTFVFGVYYLKPDIDYRWILCAGAVGLLVTAKYDLDKVIAAIRGIKTNGQTT